MRFLRRVLRASASAGVSSTLRSSTPPFLPLRTLPSASAFSWRRAERRAAISPAVGFAPAAILTCGVCAPAPALPAVAAAPALRAVAAAPALPGGLTGLVSGCSAAFASALGAFGVTSFGLSRRAAVAACPFAPRLSAFGCTRFFARAVLRGTIFPPRLRAATLPRGVRVDLAGRRATGLARVARRVGRALRFALAGDLLAGLALLDMSILVFAQPLSRARLLTYPKMGALGKTAKYNIHLRAAGLWPSHKPTLHQPSLAGAFRLLRGQLDRWCGLFDRARPLLTHHPVMSDTFQQLSFHGFAGQSFGLGRGQSCDQH